MTPNDVTPDDLNLYVITISKVYKSDNTGLSWEVFVDKEYLSVPQYNDFCDIEIAGNGDIFLTTLSRYNNEDGQIFRYTNNTWTDITNDITGDFDFQKAILSKPYNGKIFLLCEHPDEQSSDCIRKIYKTTDDGATWENIITNNLTGFPGIYYSPESQIVYFTHLNLYYFKDEEPYNIIGTPYGINTGHWDIRDIDIMGIEDGYENLLIANDGGVSKLKINISNLNNLPYENLNGNYLPIGNFLGLGVANTGTEFVVAGTVHNCSFRYENGNWILFGCISDGGDSEVNWDNPNIYYYQKNWLMRSNSGNIYSNMADWFIGMEYELNPTDPYLVYFGRGKEPDTDAAKLMIYNENTIISVTKYAPVDISKVGSIGINTNNHIYISEYSAGNNNGSRPYRFCKSVDGGDTWEDLSAKIVYYNNETEDKSINEVLTWKTIEDIIFNPADPDEIWISIGGVKINEYGNNIEPGKLRVLHSTDCGNTWYDYSEGLPAFPVMALEYHLGSDNRIFAGTDCGVFYREPSMTQWECFSEGLPVSIITDLDYEPNSDYLYASTYSRAIHKTPVPFNDYNALILPAGENITWDDNKIFYYDLIIPDNTTLTIISDIYFAEGKKIVVKRGGKLILDGGTLTNIRGNTWLGIELHGNPNEPQNSGNQGMVQIINEGTIKNAMCGIKTYKPVPIDNSHGLYEYTGGIIIANEAKFINNITAVDILPYPYNSMNSLTKCTFEANNNINEALMPECFVKLSCIDGVDIKGCIFIDSRTIGAIIPENRMIGISAINSNFWVNHICISGTNPCTDYQKTSFENLKYGIKAIASVSGKPVTIKNSIFKDNHTGIYLCEIDNATVNLNLFQKDESIPTYQIFDNFTGLYLDECTGYQIEENQFINYLNNTDKDYTGFVVNESGAENNEIYNNYIENMRYGIRAQGCNRGDLTGLQIKCNEINTFERDILVTPEEEGDNIGIAEEQGTDEPNAETSANNQFTNLGPYGTLTDIENEAENIKYYYPPQSPGYKTWPRFVYNVNRYESQYGDDWTPEDGCPSHLNQGGGIEDLKSEMIYYDQKTDSVAKLIMQLKDGGNTDELNTKVQTSTPDEAYEVYSELMAESPYLSDFVMVSSVKKENVLSGAMVTDILSSNPQAAKSDTVMQAIYERINPLTDEQIAEINQGLTTIGALEQLESQLQYYNSKRSYYLNTLLRNFRNDTISSSPSDSIIEILKNEDELWAKYTLGFEYLEKNDSINVVNTLDSISNNFNLTTAQIAQHQLYEDYFSIYLQMKSENKTIYEVDSAIIANLYTIYYSSTKKLKSLTRSLLIMIDTLTYNEPYLLPNPNKSSEAYNNKGNFDDNKKECLVVYPNPANNYIVIECNLEMVYPNSYIELREAGGVLIDKLWIMRKKFRKIMNTYHMKPGLYIASLYVNDDLKESVKFTIIN